MPDSLKNFKKHQEQYIITHNKKVTIEEEKTITEFLDALIKENNLGMMVPLKYFKDILETNRIKNQLELDHGTSLSNEGRREATHELFGSDLDLKFSEYPKYGFILDKDILRHMLQDSDLCYHYGNVILVLKKEKFLPRTTMTVGSSLDFAAFKRKCPMLLTESNICCIEEEHQKPFYDAIINKEIKKDKPGNINNIFMDKNIMIPNYELQYHGDILFSEDIEKVCLFPISDMEKIEFNRDFVPKLQELNIPFEVLTLSFL